MTKLLKAAKRVAGVLMALGALAVSFAGHSFAGDQFAPRDANGHYFDAAAPCNIWRIDRSTPNATFTMAATGSGRVFWVKTSSASAWGEYSIGQDTAVVSNVTVDTEKKLFQVYGSTPVINAFWAPSANTDLGRAEFNPPLRFRYGLAVAQGGRAAAAGVDKAHTEVCWLPDNGTEAAAPTTGVYTP